MMQFAQYFPDSKIVSAVSTQLAWSHVIEILPLSDGLQREFYITLAASERWSVRRLRKEIDGMLFERTAISGKPRSPASVTAVPSASLCLMRRRGETLACP